MVKTIRDSFVVVSGRYSAFGVIVSSNVVVYPTHLCPRGTEGTIRVSGVSIKFVPGDLNSILLVNQEIIAVRVPQLPGKKTIGSFLPLVLDESI